MSALAISLFACQKGPSANPGSLAQLDIKDAKTIFVNSGTPTKAETATPNQLFKISLSGVTSEIIITDENGNPIEMEWCYVKDLSDDIFFLTFKAYNKYYDFLVRKSDGSIFRTDNKDIDLNFEWETHTDKNNNIYCHGSRLLSGEYNRSSSIYKISQNTNGGLTVENISKEYKVQHFKIDAAGNALIEIGIDKTICTTTNGVICTNNGKTPLEYVFTLKNFNDFYIFDTDGSLYALRPNETTKAIDKVFSEKYQTGCGQIHGMFYGKDKTAIVHEQGVMFIKENLNNIKFEYSAIDRYQFVDFRKTGRYYFWNEKPTHTINNKILRLDIEKEVIETIFYDNNYTVEDFEANPDGGVVFLGMNLMTGRRIKGTVTPDGTFTEINATADDQISKTTEFVPINR